MLTGLSQRQLAKDLGVDSTTVLKWENGRNKPSQKLAKRIEPLLSQVEDLPESHSGGQRFDSA